MCISKHCWVREPRRNCQGARGLNYRWSIGSFAALPEVMLRRVFPFPSNLCIWLLQDNGSGPAGVIRSLLGFRLLRSQTPVTHLHSGGEMPDTVAAFVSESENNHLRAVSLASFIYRHHPVWPAVCLLAGRLADKLTGCLICSLSA